MVGPLTGEMRGRAGDGRRNAGSGERLEGPAVLRVPPEDAGDAADAATGGVAAVAADVRADADGLGDERARGGEDDFLDELAKPIEHGPGVVGVDRGDAAGVARVPRFQKFERAAVTDLADEDPVGPVAHGGHAAVGVKHDLDDLWIGEK